MKKEKQIYAMVHVPALPGTPGNSMCVDDIVAHSLKEAKVLLDAGFDGLIIENMHDVPYLNREVGPEIIAVLSLVAKEIRMMTGKWLGIQILAGANKAALAVAHAADLDFIRAEGFVFAHVADEGYMDAEAGELMRYRKAIGAEKVKIYADIKKKHSSHAITSDVSLKATIDAAEFFLAEGVIITGDATGKSVDLDALKQLSHSVNSTLLLGSGLTAGNLSRYWKLADGFIIGSFLKEEQLWSNALDHTNITALMKVVKQLKKADGN